ncbi:UNVERIFIED_ORG: hypothetical protein M2328_002764 [Rhodococcus erythropolis]
MTSETNDHDNQFARGGIVERAGVALNLGTRGLGTRKVGTAEIKIVPSPASAKLRRMIKRVDIVLRALEQPTQSDPYFKRSTLRYDEVTRILGGRATRIADESVRQINGRYLKADQFVTDAHGEFIVRDDGTIATESVRIRIPRDSWLRNGFTFASTDPDVSLIRG